MSRPNRRKSGSRSPRKNRPRHRAKARQIRFLFCDEAGNAGSNWLDDEQPYHVAAGWLVRADNRSAFEAVIHEAIGRSQAEELKGSRLLRRANGVQTVVQVLRGLGQHGLPFFVIADRAFCIAGKAVDTFLDPFTNPTANWLPTGALRRRQDVWEAVSRIPRPILARFAEAYRVPTPQAFAEATVAIADALRAAGAPSHLASSFENAAMYAELICESEKHGSDCSSHAVATALNAPLFFHVVKMADRVLDAYGDRMVVVHDNIQRFDKFLERTVRSLSVPAGRSPEFRGLDGELVRMGVRNVAHFETSDSKTTVAVQGADLLACSVAKLARDARVGREWSAELRELASITLPALMMENDDANPPFAGMLGHRESIVKLLLPLFAGGPE